MALVGSVNASCCVICSSWSARGRCPACGTRCECHPGSTRTGWLAAPWCELYAWRCRGAPILESIQRPGAQRLVDADVPGPFLRACRTATHARCRFRRRWSRVGRRQLSRRRIRHKRIRRTRPTPFTRSNCQRRQQRDLAVPGGRQGASRLAQSPRTDPRFTRRTPLMFPIVGTGW